MIKVSVNVRLTETGILLPRLLYTLDFIQNHPCAPTDVIWTTNDPSADIFISYGIDNPQLFVPWIPFCFSSSAPHMPQHIAVTHKNLDIYGFAPSTGTNTESLGIDIFQTIFFHISRWEEWQSPQSNLDNHGIMSSESQFLVRQGLQDIPVVDHLVYVLYQWIDLKPQKLKTQFTLSHDIDIIKRLPSFYKFCRAIAGTLLYQNNKIKKLSRLFKIYPGVMSGKIRDPYDTFEWLLHTNHPDIREKFIFFLSGGRTRFENFFKITDPECQAIFSRARTEKYLIGIHPSYKAGESASMTKMEKEALENVLSQTVVDSRQHFLRYHIPQTGQILENLNIRSDSSIGYRNKTGFRCGTGFPYRMYNFDEERSYTFIERPLVVMDMAIIHQVGWNAEKIISHLDNFLARNRNYTHITFNFHNSSFDPIMFDPEPLINYYKKIFT